jgi:lysophospholipase L1-like esterase
MKKMNFRSNATYLIILACIQTMSLQAQPYVHDYPNYDFVDYGKNQLEYFGSTEPMHGFYEKLDRLIYRGEGQLNILHVGGSHIQAGIWSGTVREALHTLHPGIVAGRGFVFPYRAARTNTPYDYTVDYGGGWEGCRNVEKNKDCNHGVLGISVTTERNDAWLKIELKKNERIDYRFTKAVVYHSTDVESYCFEFPNDPAATIETFADKGYSKISFSRALDTLHLQVKQTDSLQRYFTCYGFKLETDKPGIYYNAVGVNGADVPAYLRSPNFARDLHVTPPDLVILSIGINDALYPSFSPQAFKENYRELIRRIKAISPDAALLFTTNNDSYFKRRYVNPNGEKVKQAMSELSAEHNAAVWDMYSIMGGRGSIDTWIEARLAKTDKLHFTGDGYRLLGHLLASALVQDYQDHILTHARR